MMDGSATDCGWVLRHLFDYLDGELPDEQRRRIRAHLDACGPCTSRLAVARQLKVQMREVGRVVVPSDLERRVRSVLAGLADL